MNNCFFLAAHQYSWYLRRKSVALPVSSRRSFVSAIWVFWRRETFLWGGLFWINSCFRQPSLNVANSARKFSKVQQDKLYPNKDTAAPSTQLTRRTNEFSEISWQNAYYGGIRNDARELRKSSANRATTDNFLSDFRGVEADNYCCHIKFSYMPDLVSQASSAKNSTGHEARDVRKKDW